MLSMPRKIAERQHTVNGDEAPVSRTAAGTAFSHLAVRVFRLNGRLLAAGDALAKPAGQTSARWQVLGVADDAPATVAHISRVMGLTRQSVQRVADVLAREGLAEYVENPSHRRAKLLQLTPRGRAALRRIEAAQARWANALGEEIGEEELRRANEALDRVLGAIRGS
jgi:DNA-binding MarR family transcriptional regulator